tara:strand:- start:83 stop:556 length:474 start_codon:yes stop_codon:yes gene_type:complete
MNFKEYKKFSRLEFKKHQELKDSTSRKINQKYQLEKVGRERLENNIVQYVEWVRSERSHLSYLYLSPSVLPIFTLILTCYLCFNNQELLGGFLKGLLIFVTIGSGLTWIFNYIFKDFVRLWNIELPWWFDYTLKFYYLFFPTLLTYFTWYLLWWIYS